MQQKQEDGVLSALQPPPPHSELTFACKTCQLESVQRLLNSNVDVNEIDDAGQSAILCAVEGGHVTNKFAQYELVQLLIKRKASVDVSAHDKRTPLWCACRWGIIDIMDILLEAKADPTKLAKWNESAIDVAMRYKRVSLLHRLKLTRPDTSNHILSGFLRHYSMVDFRRWSLSDQVSRRSFIENRKQK